MNDWIKCSAVRVLNGKLQIRNPGGFWGGLFQQRSGGASKKFNREYAKSYFKEEKEPLVAKVPKAKALSLSSEDNDVIKALISQGAKKQQAKIAVQAAKARGAKGFEGIFRGALKEL